MQGCLIRKANAVNEIIFFCKIFGLLFTLSIAITEFYMYKASDFYGALYELLILAVAAVRKKCGWT